MKKSKIELLILILALISVISPILVILTKNNVLAAEGECAACGGTGKITEYCSGPHESICGTCSGTGISTHTGSFTYDHSSTKNCPACKTSRNHEMV